MVPRDMPRSRCYLIYHFRANINDQDSSSKHSLLLWKRHRHWFIPCQQRLVPSFRGSDAGHTIILQCILSAAALAWLWEHQVSGRAIMPGAALFEAAFQAAWVSVGSIPPFAIEEMPVLGFMCSKYKVFTLCLMHGEQ